jgi:hypothetical protein
MIINLHSFLPKYMIHFKRQVQPTSGFVACRRSYLAKLHVASLSISSANYFLVGRFCCCCCCCCCHDSLHLVFFSMLHISDQLNESISCLRQQFRCVCVAVSKPLAGLVVGRVDILDWFIFCSIFDMTNIFF